MASGLLIDYLGSGPIADRPAAPVLFTGSLGLWYATDVGAEQLSAWDGAVWADVGGAPGGVAWGAITGTLSAQTDLVAALALKQARTPAEQAVVSSATVTPTFSNDIVIVTAQAAALALANPTGTAIPNLGIVIRIKDDGTARAISYDTQYRAIGVTLPTTTVIGKTTYLACIWNATDTKLDVLAVGQEA